MLRLGLEFEIIQRYFSRQVQQSSSHDDVLILGIGDDCALLANRAGYWQAISVDTSIAGRHFPEDAKAFDIAYRALNVALSDLAAMGASADYFTLAISLPNFDEPWLEAFAEGLFSAASHADVLLIGGDTTRGPLSITVQVHGSVKPGEAFLRSGAKVGDYIYVTGFLGDAAAGLAVYQQGDNNTVESNKTNSDLLKAYLRPEPELAWVAMLRKRINSAIDISDGLLADLSHILRQSGVGAELDINALPLSPALLNYCDAEQAIKYALSGGDDYKLCITSEQAIDSMPQGLHCIGRIIAAKELNFKNMPEHVSLSSNGYDHFYE